MRVAYKETIYEDPAAKVGFEPLAWLFIFKISQKGTYDKEGLITQISLCL
jgi:hypothetical protein